jgi:chromosome segregation ATPase
MPPSWLKFNSQHAQDDLILHRLLFKLFRIEEGLEKNAEEITTLGSSIAGLREEKESRDEELEEARTDQAKARTAVAKAEKRIKKAEKALEDKASSILPVIFNNLGVSFPLLRNQSLWPSRHPLLTQLGSLITHKRSRNKSQRRLKSRLRNSEATKVIWRQCKGPRMRNEASSRRIIEHASS